MQLTTMRIANSIIGVCLLAVLAAALIAGQSRGNYHSVAMDDSGLEQPHSSLILTHGSLSRYQSLPQVLDSMLELPLILEIGVDGIALRPDFTGTPGYPAD